MISEKLKEIEERAVSDIREIINRVSIETRQIIEQSNGQEALDLKEHITPPSPTTIEHYPEFSFNPTDEQIRANELASSGQDLKIEAYSGSGKTSLLEIISQTSLAGKKVLYLAYNKAIATDAQSKFPRHVSCLTTHSLAYRELVRSGKLKQERISGGLYPAQIVKMLSVEDGISKLTNFGLAAYALDIVKNYCHSNDTVISKKHRRSTIISAIPKDERKIVNQAGINLAKEIWTRVINPDDNFPILHDYYLKIWTLQSPTLDFDTILVDEAQDSNAAIIGVLHKQNAQLIWVGDRYQSIYGWRGATNALSQVQSSCIATITQSFRYGSEIATLASKVLSKGYKSPILIKGNDSVASKIGFIKIPKAIISRTNAVLISEISRFNRANPSLKIYIEGGAAPLKRLVQGICDLQRGKRTLVPELASFESWSEVEEHSKKPEGISLKGISKLAKDTNLERVLKLLESRSITESQYAADTIFTTAHKAKGKEYPSVSLTDDFSVITDETHKEEVNLLYVALTRAIHELDINQCTAAQCFVE